MTYELYIAIAGTYYKTSAVFKDVEISKKRHENNPLCVYYEISGNILLFEVITPTMLISDYARFVPYINKQLDGRLKEIDHNGNSSLYQIRINFDDNYNPTTKFISASLSSNDNATKVLNNLDVKINCSTWNTTPYFMQSSKWIYGYVYKLLDVLDYVLAQAAGISYNAGFTFSFVNNLYIANNGIKNNYFTYENLSSKLLLEDLTDEELNEKKANELKPVLKISLKDILETLQNIFSIYWYFDNLGNFCFNQYSEGYAFTVDLSNYDNIENSKLTLTKKPDTVTFSTPHEEEIYFSSKRLKSTESYKSNLKEEILYPFGIAFNKLPDDVVNNGQDLNLLYMQSVTFTYNSGFPIYDFEFTGGTRPSTFLLPEYSEYKSKYCPAIATSNAIVNLNNSSDTTQNIWFTRGIFLLAGQTITITFNHAGITGKTYITDNIDTLAIKATLSVISSDGSYSASFTATLSDFYYFLIKELIAIGQISNFKVTITNLRPVFNATYGYNGFVSLKNALENYKTEMPFEMMTEVTESGNVQYNFTKKHDVERQLNLSLSEKMSDIDFNKGYFIETNYRINEITRKINPKTKFFDFIKLSKKS